MDLPIDYMIGIFKVIIGLIDVIADVFHFLIYLLMILFSNVFPESRYHGKITPQYSCTLMEYISPHIINTINPIAAISPPLATIHNSRHGTTQYQLYEK